MTHILTATVEAREETYPPDSGPTIFSCFSPVLTVPYNADSLFMDVTIYDSGLVAATPYNCHIAWYFRFPRTTGDFGAVYASDEDFYYNHHFSPDLNPFTSVAGIQVQKNGGAWTLGDQFQIQWIFRSPGPTDTICGLKSIKVY